MVAAAALALFWGLMAAACVFDLRERILPNRLSLALAVTACALVAAAGLTAPARFAWAIGFAAVLLVSDVAFRAATGVSGIGMGDVKFAAPLTLAYPLAGPAAFLLGFLALAVTGALMRRRTLPCIPFVVGALVIICLAQQ